MAYQVHLGYRAETGQKVTKECQEIPDHRVLLAQLVQMVPKGSKVSPVRRGVRIKWNAGYQELERVCLKKTQMITGITV